VRIKRWKMMVLMVSVDDVDVLQEEQKWCDTNKLKLSNTLMNSKITFASRR
jgi:hypothetical protein